MSEVINSLSGADDAFKSFLIQKRDESLAQTINVEQPANSVEPTVVSDPGTEDGKQSETVAATPKEEPKDDDQTTAVEEPIAVEKPWDADDSDGSVKSLENPYDFTKLGSALKLDGIKSESDLVSKFTELQTKLQAAETQKAATFEGIPEDLKEVIDLAKNGGDWKSYMGASSTNWNEVHPIDMFEADFARLPQFRNPDGTLNQQALDDALDTIPEGQKAYEGNRLIQERINQQQQFKNHQIQQARMRKENADKALLSAVGNLSEMFPEKEYGVKFEPRHADELFKGISSGELIKQYFTDDNGNYDMKKVVETIALRKYGPKMIKFQAEKSKVAAKKEILTSTQNVQLDTPRRSVAPETGTEKQLSPAEKIQKMLDSRSNVGRL